MEFYSINISQLNDFIFCPYSIYLHNVYQALDDEHFHDLPQTKGKQAHHTVDSQSYSTKKDVLTGLAVYSERLGLFGKIDQYFLQEKKLVERKRTITTIYDGYKLQLYAQYFCLVEMGFEVEHLLFYSMTDNKSHPMPLPDDVIRVWFEGYLKKIRSYQPSQAMQEINPNKCRHCIYAALCDQTDLELFQS